MAFTDTPYSSEGGNEVVVEQVQELAEASAPCVESGDCSVSVSVSDGMLFVIKFFQWICLITECLHIKCSQPHQYNRRLIYQRNNHYSNRSQNMA